MVLEYCDKGSLTDAVAAGKFVHPTTGELDSVSDQPRTLPTPQRVHQQGWQAGRQAWPAAWGCTSRPPDASPSPPLPTAQVAAMLSLLDVAQGMAYMHQMNMLHGDLKVRGWPPAPVSTGPGLRALNMVFSSGHAVQWCMRGQASGT